MNRSEFLSAEVSPAAAQPQASPTQPRDPLRDHDPRAAWAEPAAWAALDERGRRDQRGRMDEHQVRFDPPHGAVGAPPLPPSTIASPTASRRTSGNLAATVDEPREAEMATREALLRLQAADLIERLQVWSSDLDARESQINSRIALQDHRERQFRLWAQSHRADLEESLRVAEERAEELRAAVRRLTLVELTQRVR